jgi:hypothetical protein
MRKVLICGSRNLLGQQIYRKVFDELDKEDKDQLEILSGGAAGPDSYAFEWAMLHDIPVNIFMPDWNKYGKKAGMLRNVEMLQEKPDLVIAFTRDFISPCTAHMMQISFEACIPVRRVICQL